MQGKHSNYDYSGYKSYMQRIEVEPAARLNWQYRDTDKFAK